MADKYNDFLGNLVDLTILLDKINEEQEKWIVLSSQHVEKSYFFIEYLTKFTDAESVQRVTNILLKVLEHSTPLYQKEDLELIVNRIYDNGDKEHADEICNIYGSRGFPFLRTLYEKHNKQ